MLFVKTFTMFLIFFFTFGIVGYLLDLITNGKFALREKFVDGFEIAQNRTKFFISFARTTWMFSPVLFLAFVASPLIFFITFAIYLYDCFSRYDVTYTASGRRIVLEPQEITLQDIAGRPRLTSYVRQLKNFMWTSKTGVDIDGLRLGTTPIDLLTSSELSARRAAGWTKVVVNGVVCVYPPPEEQSDVVEPSSDDDTRKSDVQ